MKELYLRRLEKLANHLISGKLGHKEFNLCCWNSGQIDAKGCGTEGCAIGECPIVFPRAWWFSRYHQPELRGINAGPIYSGMEFFGLGVDEFYCLFMPKSEYSTRAKAATVGKRILKFAEKKRRAKAK